VAESNHEIAPKLTDRYAHLGVHIAFEPQENRAMLGVLHRRVHNGLVAVPHEPLDHVVGHHFVRRRAREYAINILDAPGDRLQHLGVARVHVRRDEAERLETAVELLRSEQLQTWAGRRKVHTYIHPSTQIIEFQI